jgi:glycosyltransferase involved in cell wall biosynthesis
VTRPAITVVVPFAGSEQQARAAIALLRTLATRPGDQLILSDNRGTVPLAETTGIEVVRAAAEKSASHARNAGAARATNDWILFLDSDVHAPADLLDKFFPDQDADPGRDGDRDRDREREPEPGPDREPYGERVGAVTGDILGMPNPTTLAERYATSRNFLGQRSHVMNPYRPRAASANLLVRRAAFEQVHGFSEGIKLAEDTDFTWRIQDLGWTLGFQPGAIVQHEYRKTLRGLARQWQSYAAGTRWLESRYPGFKADPGFNRGIRILLKKLGIGPGVAFRADGRSTAVRPSRLERAKFFYVQVMLAVNEQIGLRKSNLIESPATPPAPSATPPAPSAAPPAPSATPPAPSAAPPATPPPAGPPPR